MALCSLVSESSPAILILSPKEFAKCVTGLVFNETLWSAIYLEAVQECFEPSSIQSWALSIRFSLSWRKRYTKIDIIPQKMSIFYHKLLSSQLKSRPKRYSKQQTYLFILQSQCWHSSILLPASIFSNIYSICFSISLNNFLQPINFQMISSQGFCDCLKILKHSFVFKRSEYIVDSVQLSILSWIYGIYLYFQSRMPNVLTPLSISCGNGQLKLSSTSESSPMLAKVSLESLILIKIDFAKIFNLKGFKFWRDIFKPRGNNVSLQKLPVLIEVTFYENSLSLISIIWRVQIFEFKRIHIRHQQILTKIFISVHRSEEMTFQFFKKVKVEITDISYFLCVTVIFKSYSNQHQKITITLLIKTRQIFSTFYQQLHQHFYGYFDPECQAIFTIVQPSSLLTISDDLTRPTQPPGCILCCEVNHFHRRLR